VRSHTAKNTNPYINIKAMTSKEFAIDECARSLMSLYNKGKVSREDIENQLKEAEEDEEYEIALSIKKVLTKIIEP
jgi:hypothetical protein